MLIGPDMTKFEYKQGEFQVILLDPEGVERHWKFISLMLRRHPDTWDRGQSLPSIRLMLDHNQMKAWLVVRKNVLHMVFFTIEAEFPTCKSLQVVVGIGRDVDEYLGTILSALESWAHRIGCKWVEIIGREGWKKKVAPFGYSHLQSTFVKEISYKGLN